MRRAAKIDASQPEIVKAIEKLGATVHSLAAVGAGCPDLLIGFRGRNLLWEIKDGSKSLSRRNLTPDQSAWHANWRGSVVIVETVEQAVWLLNQV
jgi:hypothetical protein